MPVESFLTNLPSLYALYFSYVPHALDLKAHTKFYYIQDAQKFARKSKRRLVTTSDIDYALKMRSMEPVYGFSASEPMPFRAANLVGGTGGGRSIYYTEEQVVDLEEVIVLSLQIGHVGLF